MVDINVDFPQCFINILIKKTSGSCIKMRIRQASYQQKNYTNQLLETLRKKGTLTFYRQYLGADLDDMQSVSKSNKEIHFLLCVIDTYSKYACVIPLKVKKRMTITNAFQKILKESDRQLDRTWVNKGSEFYIRSMKS